MTITCTDLSIGYQHTAVLEHINIMIKKGHYVCIIGENGSGKSTLIKTIIGLIPPLKGEITVKTDDSKKSIGYIPQQNHILPNFPASVYEVVLSGCINRLGFRPFFSRSDHLLTKQFLEKLHISNLTKKPFSELSGGQQQRVLLARALCACSMNGILVVDEPVTGLDLKTTMEFYKIMKSLNQEGTTVIMITHNIHDIIDDVDDILWVKDHSIESMTIQAYKEKHNL